MTTPLVALSLLLVAATAHAECAWVLWFTSGRLETHVSPSTAFKTREECIAEQARRQPSVDDYKRKNPEDFAYTTCLPDTIDPRGAKLR